MDSEINAEIIYKAEILRAGIIEIPAHLDWSHLPDRRSAGIRFRRVTLGFAFTGYLFRPFMFFMIPGFLSLALLGHPRRLAGDGRRVRTTAIYARSSPSSWPFSSSSGGLVSAQNKRYFEEMFHMSTSIRRSIKELTNPESLVNPPTAPDLRVPPAP